MELLTAENLAALGTLVLLEVVLGIDNVIFIAILASKLPEGEQERARQIGIGLAVVSRILLLFSISYIMGLTRPLFTIFNNGLSGRDLILLAGGLFLIGKSTYEIHEKIEAEEHTAAGVQRAAGSMVSVIVQIMIIDIVFSLDSVITAVGISGELPIMVFAILVAAVAMLVFSNAIAEFVERHPTMKILALAFLILIGSILVIEGWDKELVENNHLKNYVYFAMAFSVLVELVNIRLRPGQPVTLHNRPRLADAETAPQEGQPVS